MPAFFRRLVARWKYRHFESDLAREIEVHRAMAEDAMRAEGTAPHEARAASARVLGNTTLAREDARSIWIARWMQQLAQDLRYALRGMRRQPLFAITAIAILGFATGLLTTVVMFTDASLLRPWRVPDPGSVRMIRPVGPIPSDLQAMRVPEYQELSRLARGWERLALAGRGANDTLTFATGVEARTGVVYVTPNYFDTLRVKLAAGRGFSAAEANTTTPADVVIIGYRIWQEHLHGDPNVIGTTVRIRGLGGRPFTVIGVAPRGFIDGLGSLREAWVPISHAFGTTPELRARYQDPRHPSTNVTVIGRLADGVTAQQGLAEIAQLSAAYRASAGIEQTRFRVLDTRPISAGGSNGDFFAVVLLIAGALLLVQLLACANVGNLLLARALARQREIAVRLSLGAGRARIVRQLLAEAGLLIVLAAIAGLAMALAIPGIVVPLIPDMDQRAEFYGPGFATFLVLIALAALCTVVTGLAPALRATRVGLAAIASNRHGRSTGGARLRRVLLGAQVALATVLLSGAGLLTRALTHATNVDPGFPVGEYQEVRVDLPGAGNQRERRAAFYRELLTRARNSGLPPMAYAEFAPIDDAPFVLIAHLPSAGGTRMVNVRSRPVSPEYFDVLGVPMLAGRMPTAESKGLEVVLNQLAVTRLFGGENPIGRTIATGSRADRLVTRTIVGIVPDLPTQSVIESTAVAYSMTDLFRPLLIVHSRDANVAPRIETIAKHLDRVATVAARPLRAMIEDSLVFARVGSRIAWAIGAIGLVLATIGAFGVFAYAVEERRREVGIRMALGARAPQVIALVLRTTQTTVALGLVVGVAIAAASAPLLRSYLYGLSPHDPVAYVQVAAILAASAALATWLPARRATRVNPAETLRAE